MLCCMSNIICPNILSNYYDFFLSGISPALFFFLVIKTQPCAFVSRLHSLYLMCLFLKKKI